MIAILLIRKKLMMSMKSVYVVDHSNRNICFCMIINGSFHIDHGQIIYLEKVCPVQKGHRQVTLGNSKEFI